MRISFNFEITDGVKAPEVIVLPQSEEFHQTSVKPARKALKEQWILSLATAGLVALMVIPQASAWLDRTFEISLSTKAHNNSYSAASIVNYMEKKGWLVAKGVGELNIVYIKNGVKADDQWRDRRLLVGFKNGQPQIVGDWAATVKPGSYYIKNGRLDGAFFINTGFYKDAWQIATHQGLRGGRPHEALIQVAAIQGKRNPLRDGVPTIPALGNGINQHGSDSSSHLVYDASAGCLVSKRSEHEAFIALLKSDPRTRRNPYRKFSTAIIDGNDLLGN